MPAPKAPDVQSAAKTERLRSDLQFAAENFNCLCRCFMQIGALMHAMKEGGPHVAHLIEVAHYHADQHADLAEAMRKKAVKAAEVSP